MNLFTIIEILGSVSYFTQKVLLSCGKRSGWLFGILGSIAFSLVTFYKGSFSYVVLEITSGIIYIFGLVLWRRFEKFGKWITFLMSGITILGIFVIFFLNLGSPNWILENIMVVLFAVGAVFLVLKKPIGWLMYFAGHVVLIIYAYILGTYAIMVLQVISMPVAIFGYLNFRKLNNVVE